MSEIRGVFGRGRELGTLAAFLDGLRSGPSGLLLEGEAGIGKTTLWSAGVADAAARSYLVLSSRPAEAEATLSFAALADLLDGVLERVLADLPPQQNALQVALLLEDPAGSPPEQRAVCAAFLTAIRRLAAQSPVVIAVDDLQWLDRPSAVTLDCVLRRLGTEPVGLLASVRVRAAPPPSPRTVVKVGGWPERTVVRGRDQRPGSGRAATAARVPVLLTDSLTTAVNAWHQPGSPNQDQQRWRHLTAGTADHQT